MHNKDEGFRELVLSYKTIFFNTYTILVLNLGDNDSSILFRHESFQLWESSINGFLIKKNFDYVTTNRFGINVTHLGTKDKRII